MKTPTFPIVRENAPEFYPILNTIIITRSCNIACEPCKIIHDVPFKREDELTIDQWKDCFTLLNRLGNGLITVLGGDMLELPFEGVLELVRFSKEKKIPVAWQSNSIKLTEEKAKALVEAGIDNWSASVDCLSRDPRKIGR